MAALEIPLNTPVALMHIFQVSKDAVPFVGSRTFEKSTCAALEFSEVVVSLEKHLRAGVESGDYLSYTISCIDIISKGMGV